MMYTPEEMAAKLQRLPAKTVPAMEKGLDKAGLNIVGKSKEDCTPGKSRYYRAPYSDDNDPNRKPPHMRDTITHKVEHGGGLSGAWVKCTVGTPKDYSLHVHEGTSKMQARPFILDNIVDEKDTTMEFLSEALEEAIRQECI